jgi:hypothetical protein
MHHTSARGAITGLLNGSGFGERGLALVTAASLGDADQSAVRLRQAALACALELPCDRTVSYSGELLFAPIPMSERQLCQQLCPAIIQQPCDVGMQLACLSALAGLWPHVGSNERSVMRSRFLDGLVSQPQPPAFTISSQQLCAWQRDLPTTIGDITPSVTSLRAMLLEQRAQSANRVLAEHLGMNTDLATLSWALGALTVQLRLQYHDPNRRILHVLLGTVACQCLAPLAEPEHLLTLVAQLAHQLWWCRHEAKLPPVRTCIDNAMPRTLAEGVACGDLTVAQRAARAAAKQPGEFWNRVWLLLEERIAHNDPNWTQALHIAVATAWRTSSDAVSPDDAAALGTVFADLVYREKTTPELAAN